MNGSLLVQLQRPDGGWVDVGVMTSRNSTNRFRTLPSYWEQSRRPVLGQLFENNEPGWAPGSHVAVPRWFSHLLPEGRLRQAVAAAAGAHEVEEFKILARLGHDDLPGAVRVRPYDDASNGADLSVEEDPEQTSAVDPVLKFSLAGLQMKFSVHSSDRGLTVPVSGQAGNMILKLPDGRAGFEGVPEAEHAAMLLAEAAGIRAPDVDLVDARTVRGLEEATRSVTGLSFTIARFDRLPDGRRVHVEELSQVFDIRTASDTAKYSSATFEGIAKVFAGLVGVESVGEVVDRVVLNVLVGNGDAHLKNWGLVYEDGLNPSMSPVYDVVPTVLYVGGDDLGLNLDRSKRFEDVSTASFRRMGRITGYGEDRAERRAASAAERVLDSWSVLEGALPERQHRELSRRLRSLSLATVPTAASTVSSVEVVHQARAERDEELTRRVRPRTDPSEGRSG